MDGGAAAVAETHISVVFFLGERAYKLKKPVRFEFVDLSTREARERICHREVELNRRLAPDVYLGVLDIVDAEGHLRDHLVEMRRMPSDRRLSTLVTQGAPVDACLRHLARTIAAFHVNADTSPEIASAASPEAIRRNWTDNATEMQPFAGSVLEPGRLERVHELALRYLDGREALLRSRMDGDHIRDGHGDLLADDIFCLEDGPRVLDCIEFADRLRYGDLIADVAFLAMDLERLGSPGLGDSFLAWYREFSGERCPASLADHYIAYRAQVRSKVACLRHEQGDGSAADEARSLLDLAHRRLERSRVRFVLVGGLPGTGKTTLAAAISDRAGWGLLRSDEIRKDITGHGHTDDAAADYGRGIYAPDVTRRTYAELLHRAAHLLARGTSVVADASWVDARLRSDAAAVAERTCSDLVELRCVAPGSITSERIRSRAGDASDATTDVAERMATAMDPWPTSTQIETVGSLDHTLEAALERIGAV